MCQCGYSFRIESELAYWHIEQLAHYKHYSIGQGTRLYVE